MPHLVLFGPGYTGSRLADAAEADGWRVTRIGRAALPHAAPAIASATHILSSVPPDGDHDPVLAAHGAALDGGGAWLGYLSSTGVYGDAGGAWVDEGAPLRGRRGGRLLADAAWTARNACVLRLPGIYGPGRSALDRVAAGQAHRVGLPEQVFSRIHVDDIVAAALHAMRADAHGPFNIADDLPASQDEVVAHAAALLGRDVPPVVPLDTLSPAARAFYAENRRVANGRAKRVLGWRPRFPDYRAGLRAVSATTRPASTSAAPAAAVQDQR